jgi:TusA-related sulfurtransferase
MSGEGDGDAAVFVLGMLVGAGFAHNFNTASSPTGPAPYGPLSVVVGLIFCLLVGLTMREPVGARRYMMANIVAVDAQGLSCPQPVLMTKRAMQQAGQGTIEVLVDSGTSRDNCRRIAEKSVWSVQVEEPPRGGYRLVLAK